MTRTWGWMDTSCTTSASVVSFTPWLSCHVAAWSPSASSFLLRWVSPIVCCYAYTNNIDQESLKVTGQRVSELWDVHENPFTATAERRFKAGRVAQLLASCNCASCMKQHSINLHREQKPQQQQQREKESPPLSRLQRFAMFHRIAGWAEASWKWNESFGGWLWQELPCLLCDTLFAYFNDFPHIWTVGSWQTDRTVQIHAYFFYENIPHTRQTP